MNTIRKKIYESYFYNLILSLCRISSHSILLKAEVSHGYKEKRESYTRTLLYRMIVFCSKLCERLFVSIRKSFYQSVIIIRVNKLLKNIAYNSFLGRLLKEFNLVYLLVLYVYIDKIVRMYVVSISSIWDELFFIMVVGWLICKRILSNKRYRFTSLDLPIIFFAFTYLILVFLKSPELDVAIEGYRAVVQYILWFFLAVQLIDSKKVAYRTIWLFVIGIGLIGLHGVYQYFTGAEMLGNWVDSSETITTRAYSIIGSPNALASLLVLYTPVGLAIFVAERDIIKKLIALFFTVAMGLGLLFTFSRGAWIAAFFAIMVFFFFVGRRLIIPICTILIGLLIYIEALWARISNLFSTEYKAKSSTGGRIYRWATGITEWSQSKWVGLGIGRYGGAVATNHNLAPFYMDNYYLKTLTESGIIGLTAFLLLIVTTIRQLYLYIKATLSTQDRILMFGLLASLCGVLAHNVVENIFESPFMVTYFWTNAAIIVAIYKNKEEAKEE